MERKQWRDCTCIVCFTCVCVLHMNLYVWMFNLPLPHRATMKDVSKLWRTLSHLTRPCGVCAVLSSTFPLHLSMWSSSEVHMCMYIHRWWVWNVSGAVLDHTSSYISHVCGCGRKPSSAGKLAPLIRELILTWNKLLLSIDMLPFPTISNPCHLLLILCIHILQLIN